MRMQIVCTHMAANKSPIDGFAVSDIDGFSQGKMM